MIVIEGFDGSGKSTLAAAIAKRAGVPVLHTGGPTTSTSDVLMCLTRSENRMRDRCVQDRVTHISESVYSMLTAPMKAALALERLEEVRHARMIIYCRPPLATLMQALASHKNEEYDTPAFMTFVRQNAMALVSIYDTIMTRVSNINGIRFMIYDRTVCTSIDAAIDYIDSTGVFKNGNR